MRKILFPFIALLFLTQGCENATKKKAFDFNQKLSGISDSLAARGKQLGGELEKALQSKDFSTIAGFNKELLSYVDSRVAELNTMEDIGGSGNLKTAMISFLGFEKELVTQGVVPFEQMDATTSQEDIQAAAQTLVKKTEEEKDYLKKVQDAQREYAQKNGFKIKDR